MNHSKDSIEQYLATHLLREHPQASNPTHDFLVYLAAAARQGHLCVEVTSHTVRPSPNQIWQERQLSDTEPSRDIPTVSQIIQGAIKLPTALLTVALTPTTAISTPICRLNSRYYLHRNWIEETVFLYHLERVLKAIPEIIPDLDVIKEHVRARVASSQLQPEQGEAILCACKHTVSLISGGPGTGKTYTAGQFLQLFLEGLPVEERTSCQIAVAAPTGKAAAQLEASLARYCDYPIKAQTLHSLLRVRSDRTSLDDVRLQGADLFLIDEGSMIDLRMMAHLFASTKPGARIVLLGDKDQLPSIEAGNVFADLVHSQRCPCVQLQRSLRTDSEAILNVATSIRRGETENTLSQLSLRPLELSIIAEASTYFDFTQTDPEQLLSHCQQFRLLSPLRKGPWGVEEINRQMLQLCRQRSHSGHFFAPIMVTCNDDSTGLFNGEVGLLVNDEYAVFNTAQNGFKRISAALLPTYEYAYCMSVHKSQGSEFDTVWILLPEGSDVFGRELFYTAVTRAKKQIQVFGPAEVATSIINQKSERLSGIGEKSTIH